MDQIRRVILAQCKSVGTPRALSVYLMAKYGEWAQIQNLRMRLPWTYPSAIAYKKDALVTELLRKCDLDSGVDKEQAAIDSFWASETRCCATNARLSRYLPDSLYLEASDIPVYRFINDWRKELSYALPVLPLHLTPRFSGGATYADSGRLTTTPDKMSSTPTIYQDARDLLPFFWETSWGACCQASRSPTTVRGNIFFTVPKDSTKHRGCCKEASIPVSLQLDCGRLMRTGLKRFGIDLTNGERTHRMLAQKASVDGLASTLDMSNASDTVSKVLVKLLLPKEWHTLLDSLRAKKTRIQGKWVRLEKFSSMGNGFTFELETLIFSSLARSIVRAEGGDPDLVKCYGDDLIVPSENAKSILAALDYFGFEPNEKKSFVEGPFRESCGGDFFDGEPVRAHYLKKLPDEPQDWIALANGLRRVDETLAFNKQAWMECLKNIPSDIRAMRGPTALGDLLIHDKEEHWTFREKAPYGDPIREYRVYRPVAEVLDWHHWKPNVVLACTTLGIPSSGVAPRGSISGYKKDWVLDPFVSDWIPPGASRPLRSTLE